MSKQIQRLVFFTPVILLFILSGCKSKKTLASVGARKITSTALLTKIDSQAFHFKYLMGKASAEYSSDGISRNFKVNLRMVVDSAIWMSISPALGIEAMRILITPDSILYLDRLHHTYYRNSLEGIKEKAGIPFTFKDIQNLLTGNMLKSDTADASNYRQAVEGSSYLLTSDIPRKLRKAVGLKENQSIVPSGDSLFNDVINERKLRKAKEKLDENALIISQFWIDAQSFRINKLLLDDIGDRATLVVNYFNFEPVGGKLYPAVIHIKVRQLKKNAGLGLNFSRLRLESSLSTPFSIPGRYEPIE